MMKKIQVRKWYTDNMKADFIIEDFDGVFYIKAFVRDKAHETQKDI